ncbi:FecR family protein [Tardiphaga alba]|uniref:FecR family protein n=1 Tax=Tardiphaga alba TaxID=340268 RepID=UPI002E20AD62
MSDIRHLVVAVLALAFILTPAYAADERGWHIAKSSGQVWTVSSQAQPVSLTSQEIRAGDTIRTGQNGRVLLKRGDETILIAPNSEVKLPVATSDGLSTTIIQKAGSILLDVEKKNVKHFEVETPYLAAVVKGTQFRVSVSARGTDVNVVRGQVEVADFKSGQIAQVMPGQTVLSRSAGSVGLSLSGPGIHSPIQQGTPRTPTFDRLPVPRSGLPAPARQLPVSKSERSQPSALLPPPRLPQVDSRKA